MQTRKELKINRKQRKFLRQADHPPTKEVHSASTYDQPLPLYPAPPEAKA